MRNKESSYCQCFIQKKSNTTRFVYTAMSAYGVVDLGFTNSSHRYGQFQQDIPNQCCAICSSTAILGMVFIDFMSTCQVYRDVLQNEFTSVMMLILTKVG